MKRKVIALVLAAGMALFAFEGCGEKKSEEGEGKVSEESTEETTDYYYSLEAISFDNAMLLVTQSDGEGGTYVEETGSYGFAGSAGMTIGQLMEEWDIVSFEAACEGQEFLGWVAHEQVVEEDESGFEEYNTVKLYDGKVFTTEEVQTMELPAGNITFYTVWDLTCGGCEERKVCEVFYIDDGVYNVCDSCYEEFAHGMGLE